MQSNEIHSLMQQEVNTLVLYHSFAHSLVYLHYAVGIVPFNC